jgi:hypothetical protein
VVDPRALFDGGENTQRNGDDYGDDQAEQREFGRRRQAARDFGHDGLAGRERIAEIAVGEIVDVSHKLLGQRFVEAERFTDVGDRFRCGRRAGEIHRRIARQHAR